MQILADAVLLVNAAFRPSVDREAADDDFGHQLWATHDVAVIADLNLPAAVGMNEQAAFRLRFVLIVENVSDVV